MSDTTYTPTQLRDAHSAMAETLESPDVQSSLHIDIDHFTKTVKSITSSFDVVNRKLGEIDQLGLDTKKFQPTWSTYKERYHRLLWQSRDLATKIAVQSEQFATVMLPIASGEVDARLTGPERADQIRWFIDANVEQGKESEDMKDKFTALANEIDQFKGTFSSFAEKNLKEANEQIKQLQAEVAGLKSHLDSINKKIIGLTVGLGLILFTTAALCIVFPAAASAIGGAGLSAAGGVAKGLYATYKEREETVSKIQQKTAKIGELTNTVQRIEAARAELKTLAETEISNIVGGLMMLADIWRSVNDDCVRVEQYLHSAEQVAGNIGNDPKAPPALSSYVQKGISIYTGLTKALRLYASGIDNAQK